MKRSAVVAACLAALCLMTLCSCTGNSSGGALRDAAYDPTAVHGDEITNQPIGKRTLELMNAVCTTSKPVTITSMVARNATGGLRVVAWGLYEVGSDGPNVPIPGRIGSTQTPVQAGFTHAPVRTLCKRGVDATQIDVSLVASSPHAQLDGLTVHYGDGRTLSLTWEIALCSTNACNRR